MAGGRNLRWEGDTFSEAQVESVLRALGIEVDGSTEAVFLCYCPFHGNRDTPSFAVSKTEGLFICYNPSCNKTGNFMNLIKWVGNMDDFAAKRLIARGKRQINLTQELSKFAEHTDEWVEYQHIDKRAGKVDPTYMARIKADMWRYGDPQLYMKGRGFEKDTLKKFQIGYDLGMDMVCVPMHDPSGKIEVGAVRRSITGKTFKNTPGLPTSKTLFNLHRAKRAGDSVVIVEASFSAMRLDQCGYENAVAVLMGHFNERHASLLGKYFNTITIMTDYDDKKKHRYPNCPKCRKAGSNLCIGHNPGEELGQKITELLPTKRLMWAHHGGSTRFPPGVKDPDDMDDETIRYSIKNAISNFEYSLDL